MRAVVDQKTYYSWIDIWQGQSKEIAEEMAFAMYNMGITVKAEVGQDSKYAIRVPYPQAEVAREVVTAFMTGKLEYPTQLSSREGKDTYEDLVEPKRARRPIFLTILLAIALFYIINQIVFRMMHL